MSPLNQAIAMLLFIGLAVAAGGCSTSTTSQSNADAAYTLDVLTLHKDHSFAPDDRTPLSARYILFADGTLHAESPAEVGTMELPPRIRRLNTVEREQIGMLAADAVGDEITSEPPINLESLHAPAEGTLVAVIRTIAGERRLRRAVMDDNQQDDAMAALVEALAMLAWAGERPMPAVEPGPVRYDLGPDPYSRYRRGE